MNAPRLILGVYDASKGRCERSLAGRLRDLTISWARFGYGGPILEAATLNELLDAAVASEHDYCLVLAYGTIVDDNWYPEHWRRDDVHRSLANLIDAGDFMVAGQPFEAAGSPALVDERCLLVNLKRYAACGRPTLEQATLDRRGNVEFSPTDGIRSPRRLMALSCT
jgi:hypothetical protein